MKNITLRPATNSDTDSLESMIASLYAHEELPCNDLAMRRNVKALIEHTNYGQVLILEANRKAIGYAIIVYFFSLEHGGLTALLDEFFILEDCRGHGYGSQAMNELLLFCEDTGLSSVQLEVLNENTHAKNLYLKKGFEVRDRSIMVRQIAARQDLRQAS